MRIQPSALDAALSDFAAARAEAARREAERKACEASRRALLRRHGESPSDPEAAGMLADLDVRISRLQGW